MSVTDERADADLVGDILRLEREPTYALSPLGARLFQYVTEAYTRTGRHPRAVIEALSKLASGPPGPSRDAGNRLIFTHLIERLSDAFEPALADLYDAVFTQIIHLQRNAPCGGALDAALTGFGLHTEDDLLSRRHRLRRRSVTPIDAGHVGNFIVLSRVTVGADVAITSVIIRQLRRACPGARIHLVAQPRIGELFAGDPAITLLPAPYPRHGNLTHRLSTWTEMLNAIGNETSGIEGERVLCIDTDSRLTQLGLLPVVADDQQYRIFESRTAGFGTTDSLGLLAAQWIRDTMGGGGELPVPYVRLDSGQIRTGKELVRTLRRSARHRVVTMSFGVGGNADKRAGEAFEAALILRMVRTGATVILDRGIDGDRTAADALLRTLEAGGLRLAAVDADNVGQFPTTARNADIVTWTGGIGPFAAFISASDLYIGYDSAFQHVGAALAVPVIAVVLGSPGSTFRNRWTPYGSGAVRVLGESGADTPSDRSCLAEAVLASAHEMLAD